jgi:hypothetical protein
MYVCYRKDKKKRHNLLLALSKMAISSLLSSLLPALFLAFVALSCYVVVGQGPPPDEDAVRGGGNGGGGRTFEVDFAGQRFLKDGRPYRYIAGEIHYFRIHSSLWADRLHRVRAAGN